MGSTGDTHAAGGGKEARGRIVQLSGREGGNTWTKPAAISTLVFSSPVAVRKVRGLVILPVAEKVPGLAAVRYPALTRIKVRIGFMQCSMCVSLIQVGAECVRKLSRRAV